MGIFRRRKEKRNDSQQEEQIVSSEKLLGLKEESEPEREEIHTKLSIHPNWILDDEERYVYQFLLNEMPPLQPNQISLYSTELAKKRSGSVIITSFVRNSLSKGITFERVPLTLRGENNEVLARKIFDLSELGEVPARSCRPWKFEFKRHELRKNQWNIPDEGWTLAFELEAEMEHFLDLDEEWEKRLTKVQIEQLHELVDSLPKIKDGELRITGLALKENNNGLTITVLLRNGHQKKMPISQLPLVVKDANDEIIAKGKFVLNVELKENSSKLWTFVFSNDMMFKEPEEYDLSRWQIIVPETKDI